MVVIGSNDSDRVTQLLRDWSGGDEAAPAELMPLVYEQLRSLARAHLQRERAGHTLQATALVHEAYLKLVGQNRVSWQSRSQFYKIAARMMRRILVDHARAHAAGKRGGGEEKLTLDEARALPEQKAVEIIALDDALEELAQVYPRKSEVVELKFFGGMETREISEALQISEKTVMRDWNFARLWLSRALRADAA